MTTLLDIDTERAFEEERHHRLLIAIRLASLASILLLTAFSIFDSVWEVGIWHSLLYVRTVTLAGLLIILLLSFTHWALARVDALAFGACLFFSAGVVMVSQMAGSGISIYRDPLYITFIGFTLLIPWKPLTAAWCFATVVAFYNMLYFFSGGMGYVGTWVMSNLMLCGGAIIATVSVVMIHRLRRMEFGFRRRLRNLDAGVIAAEGLDQVFPNITRAMRDPMVLFTNALEGLLAEPLSTPHKQQVEASRNNAARMIRTIDEELARARLGHAPARVRVDLTSAVRGWMEELAVLIKHRSVQLVVEGDLLEPAWVQGDAMVLEQAVGAMLAHAINQAKSGGTATVRLLRQPGHICVSVQDNGVGRTGDDLRQIFVAPSDTELTMARQEMERRTRFSLAAAHVRVRAMGGELTADSALGQGTTLQLVVKRDVESHVDGGTL